MQVKDYSATSLPEPDALSLAHSKKVSAYIRQAIEDAGGSIGFGCITVGLPAADIAFKCGDFIKHFSYEFAGSRLSPSSRTIPPPPTIFERRPRRKAILM